MSGAKPPATVAVAGLACVDYISQFDAYPEPDTKNVATDTVVALGGNAANMACGLAMMGRQTRLYTVVYGDSNGAFVEGELRARGVDTGRVSRVEGGTTSMSYVVVDTTAMTRTIFNTPAVPASVDAEEAAVGDVSDVAAVLLDGRHPALCLCVARVCLAQKAATPVVLDCERHNRPGLDGLLAVASIVVCTRQFLRLRHPEGESLAGCAAAFLRSAEEGASPRLEALVVTCGEKGAILLAKDGAASVLPPLSGELECCTEEASELAGWSVLRVPAAEVPAGETIRDTTGAGDAFQAGLAYGLTEGLSIPDSLRVAAGVATSVCLRPGTRHLPQGSTLRDLVTGVKERRHVADSVTAKTF
eukprot:Rhum_TRINITY_DN13384_c0_g1::Rhum_TRINITY_DN13384_c0_g1_i1::g.59621::m.59621